MASSTPSPISFDASQQFDGNDGKWSTFVIRVGTPEQNFRVLPAPSTGEFIIPVFEGCIENDPPNCGDLRGAYSFNGFPSSGFLLNESSTWSDIGLYDVGLQSNLNYSVNATYGLDNVGLMIQNSGGPTLSSQVIAGIASKDFYLGYVGLSPKAANFSEFEHPQRSLITTLKDEGKIPSTSYGYTAGTHYRSPKVLGSLTLGGYDQSRFEAGNISFSFDPDDSRPLSLNVQRISASNTLLGSVSLLERETYMQIDFTVPHLWLPPSTCDRFEETFGLSFDNNTGLYLVNDTIHEELIKQNPTVTIGMGASSSPSQRVNVIIPYAAFDLQAEHPIYSNTTNYFPIRRGANESQYTLGRVFMQEAYIVVDHERGNFSIHQALFPPTTAKKQIQPIAVPITATEKSASGSTAPKRLTRDEIAGIVVGIAGFILICFGLVMYWRQRQKRSQQKEQEQTRKLQGVVELPEPQNLIMEHSGEERYEMHQSTPREIDSVPKAELDIGKQPAQELLADLPQ